MYSKILFANLLTWFMKLSFAQWCGRSRLPLSSAHPAPTLTSQI